MIIDEHHWGQQMTAMQLQKRPLLRGVGWGVLRRGGGGRGGKRGYAGGDMTCKFERVIMPLQLQLAQQQLGAK